MKLNNSPETWDQMWSRRDWFAKLLDVGREVYNIFFRRFLHQYIAQDKEMIELGCGSATLTLSLRHKLKNLVGIDNSEEAVALASSHAKRMNVAAEFVTADIFVLPENLKNRFDVVWSQGLMEHFENYENVIRAHFDAAKPGGTILISVPFKYAYMYFWRAATRNKFLKGFWPYAEQKFLTHHELRELGKKFSKNYRVYLLPPMPIGLALGIIILEIKKDIA